jgi:DNA invertase Pin-like site-specific DNA recombinase
MMVCKETACNLATPAKYGYIRVNSKEQAANFSLDSPKNELISFGISEKLIFDEVAFATKELEAKPILNLLIETIKAGDSLVVTKLDRISRNTLTFLTIQARLAKKFANLIILDMPQDYDANLASHELSLTLLTAVAEFENLRRAERQWQGIALAKQQNKYLDRKTVISPQFISIVKDCKNRCISVTDIAKLTGKCRSTFYKALKADITSL